MLAASLEENVSPLCQYLSPSTSRRSILDKLISSPKRMSCVCPLHVLKGALKSLNANVNFDVTLARRGNEPVSLGLI